MITSSYGADHAGLVYGYHFKADASASPVDSDEALRILQDGRLEDGQFLWLHFNNAHAATAQWIRSREQIPEEFSEAFTSGSRSTRLELVHSSLVAVLNDVVYDILDDSTIRAATLWLCVQPRLLLSVRTQPLRSVDRLREAVNRGETFGTPLALLIHLLRDQADVLVDIFRAATNRVDLMEDRFFSHRLPARAELGGLRRDLVRLQRLLAPEPAALFRLLTRPPDWSATADAQDLRQSSEEFSVVLRDINGLQERIKLLQEEILANIGDRTNRSVFVLTAVTVTALPINMVAGLFGMNVGGIPLAQNGTGFWVVLSALIAVTVSIAWFVFRWAGRQ